MRCYALCPPRPIPAHTSVQNLALLLLPLREISHPCCLRSEKEHTHACSTTSTVMDIGTIPCAAGEVCLIQDRTPQRPDGHECRGKCGGRLHGFYGEADPNCNNPMQRRNGVLLSSPSTSLPVCAALCIICRVSSTLYCTLKRSIP